MSENVRKLVGVVAMAVLVVVGVVATSGGGDVDFTRNAAFLRMPKAQQARLAPAFVEQAAPKAIDTGRLEKTGIIWMTPKPNVTESTGAGNTDKAGIVLQAPGQTKAGIVLQSSGTHALWTGKASVLEGTGLFGKDGKTSFRAGTAVNGKTGKASIWSTGGAHALSGRKAGIWLQSGGTDGVADRIEKCASGGTGFTDSAWGYDSVAAVKSLKNVLVTSYTAEQATDEDHKDWACVPHEAATANLNQKSEQLTNFDQKTNQMRVGKDEAELLATCMESKVGGVLLKSHTEVMAADCVATVMPALSPERAKRLGTYWQTPEQLSVWTNGNATSVWTNEE